MGAHLRADMNRQFGWLVGIQVTTQAAIVVAHSPHRPYRPCAGTIPLNRNRWTRLPSVLSPT